MDSFENYVIVPNDLVLSSNCDSHVGIENPETDLLGNVSFEATYTFIINLHQQNEHLKEKLRNVNNKLQELVKGFVIQKQDIEKSLKKEEITLIELRTTNETLKKENKESMREIESLHEKLRNVHMCLKEFTVLEKKYNEIIGQNAKKIYEDAERETEKDMLLINEKKLKAQVEHLTVVLQEKSEENNKLKDLKKINEDLTKQNEILEEDTLRLNQSVIVLKEHIDIIQKQFSVQLKDDVKEYLKQISELKANENILQKQVTQLKTKYNAFQSQEQSLKNEIKVLHLNLTALNKELEKEKNLTISYKEKLLVAEQKYKTLFEDRDSLANQFKLEKEVLQKKINDNTYAVADSFINKEWKDKIQKLESEVQQKESQIQEFPVLFSIQLEDYETENRMLRQKVKDLQSRIEKLCPACQRN